VLDNELGRIEAEMNEATEPKDEPKPKAPHAADEPKPAQAPPALDITDEEWIAASQSCCGRKD